MAQRSNNNNNNRSSKNDQKKRSGASGGSYFPESGPNKGIEQHWCIGWVARSTGLVKVMCNTTKDSKLGSPGKKGGEWYGSVACSVIHMGTGQKQFYWGTMEKGSRKVVINDLGLVINPKAPNGGYCGKFSK